MAAIEEAKPKDCFNGVLMHSVIRDKASTTKWRTVYCSLHCNSGHLELYRSQHSKKPFATFNIQHANIAKTTVHEMECFDLVDEQQRFTCEKSSYDLDWWINSLTRVQRALAEGQTIQSSYLCPPDHQSTLQLDIQSLPEVPPASAKRRRKRPELPTSIQRFERFTVYQSAKKLYIVGSNRSYTRFRLFALARTNPAPSKLAEIFVEDPNERSWDEMESKLQILDEELRLKGEKSLERIVSAVAIVGIVKFLQSYHLVVVTQRRKIGCLGGNFIYGIQATQQISVAHTSTTPSIWKRINGWLYPSPEDEAEARYLGLFQFIDLSKDFYYSYSYDLTRSLQRNMTAAVDTPPQDMFIWNHFLTHELQECLTPTAATKFIQPLVYGGFEQCKCSVFGRLVSIILLARRSRHFAGTRYLKRGVADTGKVANDVEIEQIVEDESMGKGRFSSFVQYRGSIPIYWTQETSVTVPKPPIVLNRVDPTYTATCKHFADLFERYGAPILILNLVKQSEKREREVIVGSEFRNAVNYINSFMPQHLRLRYVALDYSRIVKQKKVTLDSALEDVAKWALNQTGFFCSIPKRRIGEQDNVVNAAIVENQSKAPLSPTLSRDSGQWLEQHGVLRVNCIDCLDRTNVGQFSVGLRALGQQLYAMGLQNTPILENRSQIVRLSKHLYSAIGDAVSIQYGGSEAHKKVNHGIGNDQIKHRELLTSIRRYYSNSFTDRMKQDAINLFLGNYIPSVHLMQPETARSQGHEVQHLWDLESDYYLHNFEVEQGQVKVSPQASLSQEKKKHRTRKDRAALLSSQRPSLSYLTPALSRHESLEEKCRIVRTRREEALKRAKTTREWWKAPIEKYEAAKYEYTLELNRNLRSEHDFSRMYHVDEMTYFDTALSYDFMTPVDLSQETEDNPSILSGAPSGYETYLGGEKQTLADVSPELNPIYPSDAEKDQVLHSEHFIGNNTALTTYSEIYHQYATVFKENEAGPPSSRAPLASGANLFTGEKERQAWYSKVYLRDLEICPDDPVRVRNAQIRGGATFVIQGSEFHGLKQNLRARDLIRTLDVSSPDAMIYERALDPSYLTKKSEEIASEATKVLYSSYFQPRITKKTEDQFLHDLPSISRDLPTPTRVKGLYAKDSEFVIVNDAALQTNFSINHKYRNPSILPVAKELENTTIC